MSIAPDRRLKLTELGSISVVQLVDRTHAWGSRQPQNDLSMRVSERLFKKIVFDTPSLNLLNSVACKLVLFHNMRQKFRRRML